MDKTIKNPSLSELKEAREAEMTPAISKPIEAVVNDKPANEKHWKDPLSRFDPKPLFFRLPSGNATGCEHIENNGIYVKRFSTATEGLFSEAISTWRQTSDHAAFFSRLNLILDQCIRSNVDAEQLAIIDQMPLLFFIIGLSFGSTADFEITCEACGNKYQHTIDITKDVEVMYLPDDFKARRPVVFDKSGFDEPIKAQLSIPRLKHQHLFLSDDVDRVEQYKAVVTIEQPDGMNEEDYNQYVIDVINNLAKDDKDKIKAFIDELSHFGSTNKVTKKICSNKECVMCGKPKPLPLNIYEIFQAMVN